MLKNKIKHFLKNYYLFFLAAGMALLSFFFLIATWFPAETDNQPTAGLSALKKSNQAEIRLPVQSPEEKIALENKIQSAIENNSCNLKNQILIKGYIKKIEENGFLVGDYEGRDRQVVFSEPIIFLRVFYKTSGEEVAQEEISREEIKILDDVAILGFPDGEQKIKTPLVKKVVATD